ncbi:MAG: hypothetical protein QFB87_05650, partial [Patescibacteria group bacterium]|nr:hypothetical protein [Patescibacteria group bacterium]
GVQGSASGTIKINQAYAGHVLPSVFFPVDRKVVDNNINASISVSYTVVRPGQPQQVFRSQVLDLTVGLPVELGLLKILEADQALGTIQPKKVINGATLRISYKSMQAGDQIAYKWLGQYDVSQFEDVVPGDPKTNSVDVPIPAYVIAKGLRRDGNNVSVDCEVRRGQFTYTFETLSVRLLPLAVLPTPRIRGFENTTVLPVSLVGEEPRIDIAVWDFMREDQLMWLTCTGTFDDGTPYTEKLYTANKVVAGDLIKGVSLPFPLDKARLLKDGSIFEMKFWVSFPAIPSRQTATLFGVANYVIQQLPAVLPYPTLNGASGTTQEVTVDPVTIQNDTGVTVKYPGMLATDTITLSWIFEDGTNYQATLKGQTSGSVVFDLTAAQVLHNSVNSRVQLSYSMLRGDKTTPSNVQTVMVDTIAAASLPKATINNQANGSTVDLNTFVNSRVDVGKWPLIKQGQRVWVDIIGSGKVQAVLTAYLIDSLDATNGLVNKAVRRAILTSLPLGSKFQVEVRVAFDGGTEASQAVVFPVVEYGVSDSFVYKFTYFSSNNDGWKFGPAVSEPARGGMGLFIGTGSGTRAGAVLTQVINFNTVHRYRITVPIYSTSPAGTVQPVIAVEIGGKVIIGNNSIATGRWINLTADFTGPVSGAATVAIINRKADSLGNDYYIQYVQLTRLT